MFGPFKPYYNSALDSWMMTNPGIPVTIFQIAKCVGYVFDNSMTPNNIKAGFIKCRIVPLHDFEDNCILMSSVTVREERLEESQEEITVEAHASTCKQFRLWSFKSTCEQWSFRSACEQCRP